MSAITDAHEALLSAITDELSDAIRTALDAEISTEELRSIFELAIMRDQYKQGKP